ncbi:large-conductance mechanosensitive channel protein MscL [soil metagenome]
MDLAVAVVIGTAFVALVTAFTEAFINPLLARLGGTSVGAGLGIQLGEQSNESTFVDIGMFLTAVVTFIITAAVVYFAVVVPMTRIAARMGVTDEAPAEVPPDVALLTEIRDLLAGRSAAGATSADHNAP